MSKIAVIIAAYNPTELLTIAVQSLKRQTFRDFEIIIVDDGTTSQSGLFVLGSLADSELVIRQANMGPSAARNTGVRYTTAKYLLFLDADDLMPESFLNEMFIAAELSGADITACGWSEIDQQGKVLRQVSVPADEGNILEDWMTRNLFAIHCILCRREAFDAVRGFDQRLRQHEDWDLWIKIFSRTKRIALVKSVEAIYRRLPGSNSSHSEGMDFTRMVVLRRIWKIAKREGLVGDHEEQYSLAADDYLHRHVIMQLKETSLSLNSIAIRFTKRAVVFPYLVPVALCRAFRFAWRRLGR